MCFRKTVQTDLAKSLEKLAALRQRLEDRAAGLVKGGRAPTVASVDKQCKEFRSRQHMKRVISTHVRAGDDGIPRLEYSLDGPALETLSKTLLGKTILISNRESWKDERIIRAYRSQYIIENVFKEMKDRDTGMWWPLNHWTDSKIRVHALYCTIALLLRALMYRRVCQSGVKVSLLRLLTELDGIREVINILPGKRGKKVTPRRTVLTKMSELQQRLLDILEMGGREATLG